MDCDSAQCSISAFCHCSRPCLDMCCCTLSSHTKRYVSSSPRCRYLTFVLHMVWVGYIEWRFHISIKRTKLKGAPLLGIACSWQSEGCISVESYRSHAQCWEVSSLLGYRKRTILVVLRYHVWDNTWMHRFHAVCIAYGAITADVVVEHITDSLGKQTTAINKMAKCFRSYRCSGGNDWSLAFWSEVCFVSWWKRENNRRPISNRKGRIRGWEQFDWLDHGIHTFTDGTSPRERLSCRWHNTRSSAAGPTQRSNWYEGSYLHHGER